MKLSDYRGVEDFEGSEHYKYGLLLEDGKEVDLLVNAKTKLFAQVVHREHGRLTKRVFRYFDSKGVKPRDFDVDNTLLLYAPPEWKSGRYQDKD